MIIEPMNLVEPEPGFLEEVAELARREGAVFVFDETITGFRYSNGGAQEYFGVKPDLATFGKGMANGYPVSAVAGRADIMRLMEEVFFSFTFGGEALSLAAAKATMDKLRAEPVTALLAQQGTKVMSGLAELIERHGCGDFLSVSGHPSCSFLTIADSGSCSSYQLKTLLEQEFFAAGVLAYGTHNMCAAHGNPEVATLLAAYDKVLPMMAAAVAVGSAEEFLRCEPLVPLFKIR